MSLKFNGVARVGGGGPTTGSPQSFNLDPYAGYTFRGKDILDKSGIISHIDSGARLDTSDNVITFAFADFKHYPGINNNPSLGEGWGFSPMSEAEKAVAREALAMWDDLIPLSFHEVQPKAGASSWGKKDQVDIWLSNTTSGPAQAWAYYPGDGHQYTRVSSDVWTADPSVNWTNQWLGLGDYGQTTLVHELGHTLGLSHPGAYNYDPNVTQDYVGLAEYAQDSRQYSIMSYWDASETGAVIVNWNEFVFSTPQTPMLHDILTIQSIYGKDTSTRSGDTTYGFHSNAGHDVYDFNINPYPFLSVYDAGGNDTIDLSGFTASQFLDLHAGSFSSIGQGAPDEATVNAALAHLTEISGQDWGTIAQSSIDYFVDLYSSFDGESIALDTGVIDINATEYSNFSIAYDVTIENAVGGSARDLLWGNEVDNVLNGAGGDDIIQGYEGNDTLIGGDGSDTFVYGQADTQGTDTITDFQTGVDKIDFSALDVSASNVTYNATTHQVEIDLNHDGTADMFIHSDSSTGSGDYIFHA
jgi:serralysin